MTKEAKKLKARKVENPMKWMADDAFHAAVKDELQKFISSNDYIKVPKEYMSAVLLIAWHFAEWGKPQPSLPSNLDEAAVQAHIRMEESGEEMTFLNTFKAGAEWQIEQFEKNRLAACDAQTKEATFDYPHWKPSEEQMEAFRIYLYHPQYIDNSEDIKIKLVESLYNDLKKL